MDYCEDISLVKKCLKGENQAQKALYNRHFRKVADTCMRFSLDKDKAADLTQEVFIRVFKNLDKFQHGSSLGTWIHRIAINICLDFLKKEKRLPVVYDLDSIENEADELPTQDLYEVSAQEVAEALTKLPDGYRIVLTLYALEGYSHLEIAQKLGISEGTSKSQLFKARKLLRHIFQKELQRS